MKTRILTAIALIVALPVVAQANSVMTERAFDQQQEALNTQVNTDYQVLPTQYRINSVSGGHSVAADQSLAYVSAVTMRETQISAGAEDLVGGGQSVAAATALQSVGQPHASGQGNVEVSFASLD